MVKSTFSIFSIPATDQRFIASAEFGYPDYPCSRCGDPVPLVAAVILSWTEEPLLSSPVSYEYRWHPACLGFETFDDDEGESDG